MKSCTPRPEALIATAESGISTTSDRVVSVTPMVTPNPGIAERRRNSGRREGLGAVSEARPIRADVAVMAGRQRSCRPSLVTPTPLVAAPDQCVAHNSYRLKRQYRKAVA